MIYYQLKNKIRFYFIVESELNYEEKVNEIARMISGEKVTSEAFEFAKNLLK